MKVEINKELVLSTAHAEELEVNSNPFFNYSSDEANIRLYVEVVLENFEDDGSLKELYPNIFKLINLANELNCKWLVLDCDGIISDELPIFEW
jgi:hypothetical protein